MLLKMIEIFIYPSNQGMHIADCDPFLLTCSCRVTKTCKLNRIQQKLTLYSSFQGRKIMLFNPLVGTFLLCAGLLVYEIFCSRLLAIVVGPHIVIFVIALAMLGMAAATSTMSIGDRNYSTAKWQTMSILCILLGITYAGSLCVVTLLNNHFNSQITRSIAQGGLTALVTTIQDSILLKWVLYGSLLFVPYFIFGIAISILFKSISSSHYHKIYFSDLFGAAAGCFFCVASFEYGGYPFVIGLLLVVTFLAAISFAPKESKYLRPLAMLLCLGSVFLSVYKPALNVVEPQPELRQLSRDYDRNYNVKQEWHTWNSYSRVALLSMSKNDQQPTNVYALANGDGWAWVPDYQPNAKEARQPAQQSVLAAMFEPETALVIFAGVGLDMAEINSIRNGNCRITGVELNRQMVEDALNRQPFGLKEFVDQPHISLVLAEGREYLERDTNKYDSILLSWSGASIAYYVGTSGQTTQYLYTKEAYESLIDHLTPGGILTVSNTSKAQTLIILRKIFEERHLGPLKNSIAILKAGGEDNDREDSAWDSGWDQNRLIVCPDGFNEKQLSTIYRTAAEIGHSVIYSPNHTASDYMAYRQIAEGDNLDELYQELVESKGIEFSVITDDRPYILDFTPRFLFLTPSKWSSSVGISKRNMNNRAVKILFYHFLLGLILVSLFLIIGPLLIKSGPLPNKSNFNHLIYFFSLGSGFILIEIGLIQKFRLILGNPGYAISVVLAVLILSTGIGSYFSKRLFATGKLTYIKTVFCLILYLACFLTGLEYSVKFIIPMNTLTKIGFVMITLFPLGFFMGQLFPQGLVRAKAKDINLVPWAWAINGAASTVAVCLGLLLSQPFGFNAIIYAGAGFYMLIFLLPDYWQQAKSPV